MSLKRLAGTFGVVAAAVLSSACTVYPTIGRHGDVGIGVAPAPVYVAPYNYQAPVYVAPQPRYYAPAPRYYVPPPHRHYRHW